VGERRQRLGLPLVEAFERALEVETAEGPYQRALRPVLVAGREQDRGERHRHQDVPLPPREVPASAERDHEQRLGQEQERHRDHERQRSPTDAVDAHVPPCRERVRGDAQRQEREQPWCALGLEDATHEPDLEQRSRGPGDDHDQEPDADRPLQPQQRRLV
jgi:hypothetical protein